MTPFKSPMLVSEIPGHQGRINAEPYLFVQPKLDGHCCMANTRTRRIYSRQGHEITTLPHINAALPTKGPEWLHGELWKPGATSDSVAVMIRCGDISLRLHVFDYVSDEEFSIREHQLNRIPFNETFDTVPTLKIAPSNIKQYYKHMLSLGYEGMIIRLDGHPYYHGRSQNVFKMKPKQEDV